MFKLFDQTAVCPHDSRNFMSNSWGCRLLCCCFEGVHQNCQLHQNHPQKPHHDVEEAHPQEPHRDCNDNQRQQSVRLKRRRKREQGMTLTVIITFELL